VVLVLVLLVLFLGDLRAALTVALILPLAALATFILMRQFNLSANLMSLGGLAIAIGMLVDAAVVVVENIVTQLAHAGSKGPAAAAASDLSRHPRGGGAGGLRHPDHHHRVPAAADPAGAGGQAVRAGGADHRVRAGQFAAVVADRDPGAGSFLLGKGGHEEPWVVRQMLRSTARC
jgi:hypothetical protein